MHEQVDYHPPYIGAHSNTDAPEAAYKRGDRVRKSVHEEGDAHQIGDEGEVLGSIAGEVDGRIVVGYFVAFDDEPLMAMGILDYKLEKINVHP